MLKGKHGFTFLELVVVIVCIGILIAVTLPTFINISEDAEQKSEEEIVGNVQTGLQLVYSQNLVDTGVGSYPVTLDNAPIGQSSPQNPFFVNVLQDPYRDDDWTKINATNYQGPAGNTYTYNSNAGTFSQVIP